MASAIIRFDRLMHNVFGLAAKYGKWKRIPFHKRKKLAHQARKAARSARCGEFPFRKMFAEALEERMPLYMARTICRDLDELQEIIDEYITMPYSMVHTFKSVDDVDKWFDENLLMVDHAWHRALRLWQAECCDALFKSVPQFNQDIVDIIVRYI